MSKTLVEVDEFTADIEIASQGDPKTEQSWELPLQRITNRTLNLNNRVTTNTSGVSGNTASIVSNTATIATHDATIAQNSINVAANTAKIGTGVLGPHEARIVALESAPTVDALSPLALGYEFYTGTLIGATGTVVLRDLVVPQGASAFIEVEITGHGAAAGANPAWTIWRLSKWLVTTWDGSASPDSPELNIQPFSATEGTGLFEAELKGQSTIDSATLDLLLLTDDTNTVQARLVAGARTIDLRYNIKMMLSE